MAHYTSPSPSTDRARRSPRPRTSVRVRNVVAGVVYHLVFEGDVRRLSGRQLRHHLARISHVPPSEQQLFVHGQMFEPDANGAAVGLQEDDVIDLVQIAADGGLDVRGPRGGASAAAVSSPRPSTNTGTLSPEAPRQGYSHPLNGVGPGERGAGGGSASASMASAASTRRAPSPDRLVSAAAPPPPPPPPPQHNHSWLDVADARPPRSLAAEVHQSRGAHPAESLPYPHRAPQLNDSSLPLWTSATTLSSLPSGADGHRSRDVAASPRPRMPAETQASLQPPPPLTYAPSASKEHRRLRPSYEVASPPPPLHTSPSPTYDPLTEALWASPPPPPHGGHGAHATPAAGLNHSRYDDHYDGDVGELVHRRGTPSPPTHPRASGTAVRSGSGGVVIRADELHTILDEQNYVWQMEDYRFRTERQNRLVALQQRQRELTFESVRYDEAVAEVERQLARERQRLVELQRAMLGHHTTASSLQSAGLHHVARTSSDLAATGLEEEEVMVDV
ncbi:hypothetical protein NESM_000526100 [Novymonas esmeraldas]|uniref:Ubiquitin-like domain-containing protein n=1 Tax=Novymonas esmeraldas TaxID=1808958 RepID=A0AAW0EQE1_9TRYP